MKKLVSFIFGIFLILPLAPAQKSYTYTYADGNGNKYLIATDRVEYQPVQPSESSSGTYSGGQSVSQSITKDQYLLLESALRSAIDDTTGHIASREMGSGMIAEHKAQKDNTWFIDAKSVNKAKIENQLTAILKK